jgi:phospholipid/cholesterol/gamma-HCH transport system permease protein
MIPATIEVDTAPAGVRRLRLSGQWTLVGLAPGLHEIEAQLRLHGSDGNPQWDLEAVAALDSVGATLLWRTWGRRFPEALSASPEQRSIFERIAAALAQEQASAPGKARPHWPPAIGTFGLELGRNVVDLVALIGQLLLDLLHCLRHPRDFPLREVSATIHKSGVRAMPVSALVGFLIGIVLSYLSALQLRGFGAEIFIVNILGLGIIRELGPVLVAVLVAGRSGSAMTAQLGVMRVTEEIDALAIMGISRTLRLVLPKVLALSLAMPLLVLWTTASALIGGMVSAQIQLDLDMSAFVDALPRVVPVSNLWIGLAKGVVFGFLIALLACHFGLRVRPNTESLSANTTRSVVTSITAVILVDAVFAVATRSIGLRI